MLIPSFSLDAFRFYADSTSGEAASTALATQGTNISRDPTTDPELALRLRVQENVGNSGAATDDWQLQCSKNGGSYADVSGASSNVRGFNSANLTDGGSATNILTGGSGSYVTGLVSEDGLADNLQVTGNNFTEFHFALQLQSGDLADTDTLDFRLLRNGSVFTYNVTPRITVSVSGGGGGSGGRDLLLLGVG